MKTSLMHMLVAMIVVSVSSTASAGLGQRNDGDSVGGPGTRSNISDGGRESGKGGGFTGRNAVGDGIHNGKVKTQPPPVAAPAAAPTAPLLSPADVKIADNKVIQKAEEKIKADDKKLAVLDAVVEALGADPVEMPSKKLEATVTAVLDGNGLCKQCDMERNAIAKAKRTELSNTILQLAKEESGQSK